MDALRFGLAIAAAFLTLHVVLTFPSGLLPSSVNHAVGASASTHFARPWSWLSAPLFHKTWGHVGYNVIVIALVVPPVLRHYGIEQGVLMALLGHILALTAVHGALLVVSGVPQEALDARLVGSSLFMFAALGLLIAAQGWAPLWVAGAVAAFIGYEIVLRSLGATTGLVPLYHIAALLNGVILGTMKS